MFYLIILTGTLLLSSLFTQMKHPLAMGLVLLAQTLCICMTIGFTAQSYWFSYILFLVFLGGLLVLFIYVTSLASNEMFSMSMHSIALIIIPLTTMLILALCIDPALTMEAHTNTEMLDTTNMNIYSEEASLTLIKLFNHPTNLITPMLILYLFLTLIAIVKITDVFFGPLRQKI